MKKKLARIFAITGYQKLKEKVFPIEHPSHVDVPVEVDGKNKIKNMRKMWSDGAKYFKQKKVKYKQLSHSETFLKKQK